MNLFSEIERVTNEIYKHNKETTMSHFEVQEYCLFGGWTNTWSYEDDEGNTIPTSYDTKEDAEIELDYFFKDMQDAVDNGNMEDVPDRNDFRIVEVNK